MPRLLHRRALLKALPLAWLGAPLAVVGQGVATDAPPLRDWFIFLESGQPTPPDKEAVAAMQRRHIDNFKRLFGQGKLFGAGPLRDPARVKRGIVVVRAHSREELMDFFAPDDYVREGYMSVHAVPARVRQPLGTTDIDPSGIEEVRILMLSRPAQAPLSAQEDAAAEALLRDLLARRVLHAGYQLQEGPIAEVLFARGTDDAALQAALADYPGLADQRVSLSVWAQWLGKGVLR